MSLLETIREISPKAARLAARQARGLKLHDLDRALVERITKRAIRLERSRVEFDVQPWVKALIEKGRRAGSPGAPSHVVGAGSSAPAPTTASVDARRLDRASFIALAKAKGLTLSPDVLESLRDPVVPQIAPEVRALEEANRETAIAAEAARRAKLEARPRVDFRTVPVEDYRAHLRELGIDGTLAAELGETAQRPPPTPEQRAQVAAAGPDLAAGRRHEVQARRAAMAKVSRALLDSGGRSERRGGRSVIVGGTFDVRRASPLEEQVLRELRGLAPAQR